MKKFIKSMKFFIRVVIAANRVQRNNAKTKGDSNYGNA